LSYNNLGARCYEGKGVDQNYHEAFMLFWNAAEQGIAEAMKNFKMVCGRSLGAVNKKILKFNP
jgi:TPR repeat protein